MKKPLIAGTFSGRNDGHVSVGDGFFVGHEHPDVPFPQTLEGCDILHSELVTAIIDDKIMDEKRGNLAVSKSEPPLPKYALVRRGLAPVSRVSFIEADARAAAVGMVND